MTRRRLTPDEVALWRKVTDKAERLHPGAEPPLPKPKPKKTVVVRQDPVPQKPAKTPTPAQARVAMDHKAFSRLKRGKLKPEARLDLHGMRVDEAHSELNHFILTAQARGLRLVLVITGKAGPEPDRFDMSPYPRGILNRQVPQWLAMPPLVQAVLQVSPAHIRHGGNGALYVYLRRVKTAFAPV